MFPFLPLFVFLIFPDLSIAERCNPGDRDALLTFKNSLSNPEILHSWNASKDCCSWNGVHCDGTNYVTRLQLTNNLKGQINPSLANLKQLTNIVFIGMPNLIGTIPEAITRMKNLGVLILFGTGLSGPIPNYLSNLKKLSYLDLSSSNFSGPIPGSLTSLPILNVIILSNNRLTGPIPESFGHFAPTAMDPLPSLGLSNNKLSGTIPASFLGAKFTSLDISGNSFSGDASMLFRKDNGMGNLIIAQNNFAFNLSEVEFPTTLNLLDISQNMIYGGIPQQIVDVTFLDQMNMSYNQLCGQIPVGWKSGIEPYTWDASSFEHNKCLCGAPLAPCK